MNTNAKALRLLYSKYYRINYRHFESVPHIGKRCLFFSAVSRVTCLLRIYCILTLLYDQVLFLIRWNLTGLQPSAKLSCLTRSTCLWSRYQISSRRPIIPTVVDCVFPHHLREIAGTLCCMGPKSLVFTYLPKHQYSETNVMNFLFNLLRINSLYMFRTLLAHPQEALNKRHFVYCVHVFVGWLHQG
jgi:hypothetical protein